jgi:hypothetical protein
MVLMEAQPDKVCLWHTSRQTTRVHCQPS